MSTTETTTTYDGSFESLQAYFDAVASNLKAQLGRAASGGACEYRTADGRACAVGAFIPDYHAAIESGFQGSVMSLAQEYPELGGIAWPDSAEGLRLAKALQTIHDDDHNWDGVHFVASWTLVAVAQAIGLNADSAY